MEDLQSFNYSVSHDLRSPVSRLKHHLYLLNQEVEKNENIQKRIEKISTITSQIEVLIDEIMRLSQVENLQERFSSFILNELFEDTISELRSEAFIEHIKIFIAENSITISGDRVLLKQAFYNILSNCVKFVKNEVNPKIEIITSLLSEDKVEIVVKDNGMGLDQGINENDIFKLFVKGKNSQKGVGAGLAIVKKIIEKHNGKVWAARNNPKGLSIFVILNI